MKKTTQVTEQETTQTMEQETQETQEQENEQNNQENEALQNSSLEVKTSTKAEIQAFKDAYPEEEEEEEKRGLTAQERAEIKAQEQENKEEFYGMFSDVFQFAGSVTGLQSLPISEKEEKYAKHTANVVYESLSKYEWFQKYVMGDKEAWAKRYMPIFIFGSMKITSVKMEIDYRKELAKEQAEKGRGANEQSE